MSVKEVLQFIFLELQIAINEKAKERALELGSAIDVLFEAAKKHKDRKALDVLERMNYLVFHYDDEAEFPFVGSNIDEISKTLSQMKEF